MDQEKLLAKVAKKEKQRSKSRVMAEPDDTEDVDHRAAQNNVEGQHGMEPPVGADGSTARCCNE